MNQQKRRQAFKNAKLDPEQRTNVRVPIKFGKIKRGDGRSGLVEDVIAAYEIAMAQFNMETAGTNAVGTIRLSFAEEVCIESVDVLVDDDPQDPAGKPNPHRQEGRGAGTSPREPGVDTSEPTKGPREEAPEPNAEVREQAFEQALHILEDYRDSQLIYWEDIEERINTSVCPVLVRSVVTEVRSSYVSRTPSKEIRWKGVSRITGVLPTRMELEVTGHVQELKTGRKQVVQLDVKEVLSEAHVQAVAALRRKITRTTPMGYATDLVGLRMSLFRTTKRLLRFKGTSSRGLVAGDHFEFMVSSVDLANAEEGELSAIEQAWHEELYRR